MTKSGFIKKLVAIVITFILLTVGAVGFAIYALTEVTEDESVAVRILEESEAAKQFSIRLDDKLIYETTYPAGKIEVLPGELSTLNIPVDDDEIELTFVLDGVRKDTELDLEENDKIDVHISDETFEVNIVETFNPVL